MLGNKKDLATGENVFPDSQYKQAMESAGLTDKQASLSAECWQAWCDVLNLYPELEPHHRIWLELCAGSLARFRACRGGAEDLRLLRQMLADAGLDPDDLSILPLRPRLAQ